MKIALLGSAPSSCGLAPFKNIDYQRWARGKAEEVFHAHGHIPGDFEIWGCSPAAWAQVPRADRWFEVHRWEPGQAWFSPEYCRFLQGFPDGALYTGARIPDLPAATVYPIDAMEEKFSSYFMTSSLALMLALAIDTVEKIRHARRVYNDHAHLPMSERPNLLPPLVKDEELTAEDSGDIIGMWGVDMAATEEYGYQRPGCQFFILEAMRRGIKVFLPPESDLMRPMPVYGISEWDHNYIKMTSNARMLSGRGQEAQRVIAEAQAQVHRLEGEMSALNQFVHTWSSPYGMKHGMVISQEPGTGLGSGITSFDGRPVTRMTLAEQAPAPVVEAMVVDQDTAIARELIGRLAGFKAETGIHDATPAQDALALALAQAKVGREHSELLQRWAQPGESSLDTLARIMRAAVEGPKKATPSRGKMKTKQRR